jgi:hypothetical protein
MARNITIQIEYDTEVVLECLHCDDFIVIPEGTDQHSIAKMWIPVHMTSDCGSRDYQFTQNIKVREIDE